MVSFSVSTAIDTLLLLLGAVCGFTYQDKTCWHLFSFVRIWLKVNQVNGSGLRRHPIFSDCASHCERRGAHRMHYEDAGGGQTQLIGFPVMSSTLWRCPPAPFTFEFLSRPNRSVLKYTLKKLWIHEFSRGISLARSISPRGKFSHSDGKLLIKKEEERE